MKGTKDRIILCDAHQPVLITPDSRDLVIRVLGEMPQLPEDIETLVSNNWSRFVSSRPTAKDNPVTYLISYKRDGESVRAEVRLGGFKYNQFFNRDDRQMLQTGVANSYGFNVVSSWILISTKDGYAIFGNKGDIPGRSVSAFGGFTNQSDITEDEINVNSYLERVVRREMGEEIGESISHKHKIGLDFAPDVGPRGFDGLYHVRVDIPRDEVLRLMGENEQFSRDLIPVELNPRSLVEFLNRFSGKLFPTDITGTLSYVGAFFGEEEMQRALNEALGQVEVAVLKPYLNGEVRDRISDLS